MAEFEGDDGKKKNPFEVVIIAREGDEAKSKKPFKFNFPAKLVVPMKNALADIIQKSNIE